MGLDGPSITGWRLRDDRWSDEHEAVGERTFAAEPFPVAVEPSSPLQLARHRRARSASKRTARCPVPTARSGLVIQDVAALQLLVPEAEQLLDAVRGLAEVGLLEPAHVSLGYPWRTAEAADPSVVSAAAARTRAFQVRFAEAQTFSPDGRGRVLVHVAPDDEEPFHELARVVQADLRQVHLSVARVMKHGDVAEVVRRVVPLLPLVATVRLLELTVQRGGVWQPGRRFALTG